MKKKIGTASFLGLGEFKLWVLNLSSSVAVSSLLLAWSKKTINRREVSQLWPQNLRTVRKSDELKYTLDDRFSLLNHEQMSNEVGVEHRISTIWTPKLVKVWRILRLQHMGYESLPLKRGNFSFWTKQKITRSTCFTLIYMNGSAKRWRLVVGPNWSDHGLVNPRGLIAGP